MKRDSGQQLTPVTDRALIVLARAPVPGEVKTRLATHLGDANTALLYACFVRDMVLKLHGLADADLIVYHAPCPAEQVSLLKPLLPSGASTRPQTGATFGDRLCNALGECGAYERRVLVGTDSPTLPPDLVEEAFESLERTDVVLGPATDGGYYLIGVKEVHPRLFEDIDWSTSVVLSQTIDRARELGLRLTTLPVWYDVDEIDDLRFLNGHVAALSESGQDCPCPHTCALLPALLDGAAPPSSGN